MYGWYKRHVRMVHSRIRMAQTPCTDGTNGMYEWYIVMYEWYKRHIRIVDTFLSLCVDYQQHDKKDGCNFGLAEVTFTRK